MVMGDGRFAGVDWASEEHAVCVVDERGRIVEGRRYRHDERGIRALCARLLGQEVALVAIERPDGLLIERLLDAGLSVVAVHPNQVKAMRPRYSVAGGKSDGFDSFVLADAQATASRGSSAAKTSCEAPTCGVGKPAAHSKAHQCSGSADPLCNTRSVSALGVSSTSRTCRSRNSSQRIAPR